MTGQIVKTLLIFLVIVVLVFFGYLFSQVTSRVGSDTSEVIFTAQAGDGVKDIAQHLKEQNLIGSQFAFRAYVFLTRATLKAGDYTFRKNMTIKEITAAMRQGKYLSNEVVIQVIEGWNNSEIAAQVATTLKPYTTRTEDELKGDFLQTASATDSRKIIPGKNYDFLMDKPNAEGLEGYLFPDTYRVYKNSTSGTIIEKMLDNFGEKLTTELREAIKTQGKTIYSVVTMASIVEKEVRTDADRKMVADIFYRRIAAGMPLQSDATVNYATGKSELQPTIADTEVDSAYNTYLHRGLPPGPICNPSLSAMQAAIYPTSNEYWYYLNKKDGTTVFAKTLEEQNANKVKYLE